MTLNISLYKKVKVLVLGDLMIDEYLWGDVDRISPEAPVPVVAIKKETTTLGGAGNVINNLIAMGASVSVVGTAGMGSAGRLMLDKFKELDVDTSGIVDEPDRPTTKKTRVIAANQQVLRIDRETRKKISSSTLEKLSSFLENKIPQMDLVLISDYDKGLVTKELIQKTVAIAEKNNTITIGDPKGFDFSKYKNLLILTPNQKEAGVAAGIEISSHEDLLKAGRRIIKTAGLKRLLITCGKNGMVGFDKNEETFTIQSQARQVFDVSGAGDTVISILGLSLASGATFKESAAAANAAAGIVVAKVGTATASLTELKNALLKKNT
ncbi:MAG: D-glycero-beta-D-manno-heptose-7-phosphate kinase [Thermodesulfobacteriota bacterium]|nr:D-glycero-beta-D-manno-heptose-7-phosphate kinase [Thermodesulfobacteriota bacterium]